jgi:hypothetical protein
MTESDPSRVCRDVKFRRTWITSPHEGSARDGNIHKETHNPVPLSAWRGSGRNSTAGNGVVKGRAISHNLQTNTNNERLPDSPCHPCPFPLHLAGAGRARKTCLESFLSVVFIHLPVPETWLMSSNGERPISLSLFPPKGSRWS